MNEKYELTPDGSPFEDIISKYQIIYILGDYESFIIHLNLRTIEEFECIAHPMIFPNAKLAIGYACCLKDYAIWFPKIKKEGYLAILNCKTNKVEVNIAYKKEDVGRACQNKSRKGILFLRRFQKILSGIQSLFQIK